jgi:DNA-binding LacI/PurR family transcriptional regulator
MLYLYNEIQTFGKLLLWGMIKMPVTLKDIAKRANVSISTVSRVINNDTAKPASKHTADKIWKIVKEMGYVPNQSARKLIKGEDDKKTITNSKAIGCIFTSTKDTYNDPFYSQIAVGIQEEISKRGYILAFTYSSYETSFSALYNNLSTNPVSGIIVLGRFDNRTLDFLKNNFNNIVYAGVNYVNGGFDEVICDGYKGTISAIEHLIKLGYKTIGFAGEVISVNDNDVINEHRHEAYKDVLRKNNMPYKEQYVVNTSLATKESYANMKKYLENNDDIPEVFFCANDVTAIGAMKAIREKGLLIPNDIGVIGLDDIEMASFVTPSLTTIRIPKEELGKTAAKILIDKIESEREFPIRVDIPYELKERESC